MTDIIVIGAGVTGCAVASGLSRYHYSVTVLEKASDVCEGTSKANSGIVHAGYDARPGTLKAKLNVGGNRMMEQLSADLDFPFVRNGSLVLMFDEGDRAQLQKLLKQAEENGVEGVRIVEKEELAALEPNVSEDAVAALYAPTGGIVCPFGLTVALAENAADNGVDFRFHTEVQSIDKIAGGYRVNTSRGEFTCRAIVNAAGVYADKFHNMVSADKVRIIPRKGEYCLFDKQVGNYVRQTIFQLPTKRGKGVLVTPTVHGNLLVGPTAVDTEDPEDISTTKEGMDDLMKKGAGSVKALPVKQVITSFAGLRAHAVSSKYGEGDFIIGEVEDAPGFFDVAGIESPGLSCAPAIGKYVTEMVIAFLPTSEKKDFKSTRKGIPNMAMASYEERERLIAQNPLYANVICRCELVTEGEIVDAIHRNPGATTLDGVKRRTRAGMGRCQAGFCSPKTVEILARELGKDIGEINKNDDGSYILTGRIKDNILERSDRED